MREPSTDDLASFRGLEDIMRWTGLRGGLDYQFSQTGALLVLLGADGNADAAEFAPIASPSSSSSTRLLAARRRSRDPSACEASAGSEAKFCLGEPHSPPLN